MSENPLYKYNQTIVKKNGTEKNGFTLKLTRMNVLRNEKIKDCVNKQKAKKGTVNSKKLLNNLSRAKRNIFELAVCNDWDWFVTITLANDRSDLIKFHKQFIKWLSNYNAKYSLKIKFLLVPEKHKDKTNWHMHGFLRGLPLSHLEQITDPKKTTASLAKKIKRGDKVYNWNLCTKKFGKCDIEPIKSVYTIGKYMCKQINKVLSGCVSELNSHLYYHSRGLNVGEVLEKGVLHKNITSDYANDFCSITTLNFDENTRNEILSKIY